jgi:hypothetical protein
LGVLGCFFGSFWIDWVVCGDLVVVCGDLSVFYLCFIGVFGADPLFFVTFLKDYFSYRNQGAAGGSRE